MTTQPPEEHKLDRQRRSLKERRERREARAFFDSQPKRGLLDGREELKRANALEKREL